ncbi:MAG: efflux RND transporter permease subunit [Treponema sp.]|nr:efflux RND transporter permease subunit [Treponema sp.]
MEKLYRHPWIIVLVITMVTIFFAFQMPRLELDNNNFRFISEDDPARLTAQYIDDIFGSSIFILVALHRETGDVFDPAFLTLIRDYVEKVEAIEIIDPSISIVNADYITGDSESVIVEKLLPADFTGTPEEIVRLKEKILSWDMYKRSLVSDDFSSTQILVPLNIPADEAGSPEVVDSFIQVRDIAREMFAGAAAVYVTGIPVISATINEAVRADLSLLVPLVIIVVLLILFFSFRRLSGVVLPLLTVIIAAVWSMGAMPLFNIKLSIISTILPVILVAVGSAYGIHVVTHFFEGLFDDDKENHRNHVIGTVKKIAKPVFLAALTTLAGFLSFCFTTVLPIREFGFFAGFGVLISFAVALTLIPALLIIRKTAGKGKGESTPNKPADMDRFSGAVRRFFSAIAIRQRTVLLAAALIIVFAALGTSRLIIDNVFIEYFKPGTDIAKSDRFIREEFGGSKIVSVVAEAKESEILLSPACLLAMDNLSRHLETHVPETGKTMGFTDLIKRINQVFNADESPEGIRSVTFGSNLGLKEEEDWIGFGFDEEEMDFGFGNFGIDDAQEFGFGLFEKDQAPLPESAPYTLEGFVALLSRAAHSGNSSELSAMELVKELKKLVNFEGAAYYEIPANPAKYGKTRPEELAALMANYLILLSGNIDAYSNDPLEPTAIKTTIQLRTLGETDTMRAVNAIYRFVEANFPEGIDVTVGGSALVETSLNQQVVRSQLISLIISLALVFLTIAFSYRSAAAGFIGIAPLSISILINFAVMGFLGIKLNLGTSMIASLAVGIGIDYTIHYIESFKRELYPAFVIPSAADELRIFLSRTFAVSGKAIIINALSVGAGFAVLIFSRFNMLGHFGFLIALTMGVSAMVSLLVIPALLLTLKPAFVLKAGETKKGD